MHEQCDSVADVGGSLVFVGTMAQAISLTEKVLLPGVFKTLCELPEIHHKGPQIRNNFGVWSIYRVEPA